MPLVLELDGAELVRLRATPATAVRASLHRVWVGHPGPESARELAARPRESLAEIAAELGECHDRLIAPHWERIRPALARRLGVTPSAVSRHLAVLYRGGLVDKRRSGRAVLYQTTALGLALLGDEAAWAWASAS